MDLIDSSVPLVTAIPGTDEYSVAVRTLISNAADDLVHSIGQYIVKFCSSVGTVPDAVEQACAKFAPSLLLRSLQRARGESVPAIRLPSDAAFDRTLTDEFLQGCDKLADVAFEEFVTTIAAIETEGEFRLIAGAKATACAAALGAIVRAQDKHATAGTE